MTLLEKISLWGSIASVVGLAISVLSLFSAGTTNKSVKRQSVTVQENHGNVFVVQGEGNAVGASASQPHPWGKYSGALGICISVLFLVVFLALRFLLRHPPTTQNQEIAPISQNSGDIVIVQGDNNTISAARGVPAETLALLVARYEQVIAARDTALYQKDEEVEHLRAAVERVQRQAVAGDQLAVEALDEATKTGKLDLIQSALIGLADRFSGDIAEDSLKRVVISREIATVAFHRGDIEEAQKRLDAVLATTPDDIDALNILASIHILKEEPDAATAILNRMIEIAPLNPEVQCVGLGNLANVAMIKGDVDEAARLHTDVLRIAKEEGLHAQLAMAQMNLGLIRMKQDRADLAESDLAEAVKLFESLNLRQHLPKALCGLARASIELGHLKEASSFLARAKEETGRGDNPRDLAECHSVEGWLHYAGEDYASAADSFEREVALAEKLRSYSGAVATRKMLGLTYLLGKRYDRAVHHFRAALYGGYPHADDEPESHLYYGQALVGVGELDEALRQFQTSLALSAERDDQPAQLECHRAAAEVYKMQNNKELLIASLKAALEISSERGDQQEAAHDRWKLAVTFAHFKDFKTALPLAQEVVHGITPETDPAFAASAHSLLGEIYRVTDMHERALEHQKRAAGLYAQAGRSHDGAQALNNLASSLITLGHTDVAEEASNEALITARFTADDENRAIALGNLSSIYLIRDDDHDKAESLALEALALNRRLGRDRGIAVNYITLAQIWESRGDMAKSKVYRALCLALPESATSTVDNWSRIKLWLEEGDQPEKTAPTR